MLCTFMLFFGPVSVCSIFRFCLQVFILGCHSSSLLSHVSIAGLILCQLGLLIPSPALHDEDACQFCTMTPQDTALYALGCHHT
jgi:hypothetical protein